MEHLKLTFENIMKSGVLFYDKIAEDACFDICSHLKIDNLPSIDSMNYYELENSTFQKKEIRNEHCVFVDDSIFESKFLNSFKINKQNVLFVFEESVIRGVVHISDYNGDIVLQSIQDDMLSFERKLRQLFLLNGFVNEDMYKYFIYKKEKSKRDRDFQFLDRKIKGYQASINEINSLGQFQLCDFGDLMGFAGSKFSGSIFKIKEYTINGAKKQGTDILREMRNMAMHAKNPISKDLTTSIYNIDSLMMIFESLQVFRQVSAELINKIRQHPDFLRSIELENRSKLQIIHEHHPKALEYFLGF